MGILKKAITRDKQMQLAFGLMDTINANIIEIARECVSTGDKEYCDRALAQFIKFDENTCRAIEYIKHEIGKGDFGIERNDNFFYNNDVENG